MKKKLIVGLMVLVLLLSTACSKAADNKSSMDGGSDIEGSQANEEIAQLPSHDEFVAEVDGRGISKEIFEKNYLFRKYSHIMNYGEEIFEGEGAKTLEDNLRYQVQEELARELIYIMLAENLGFVQNLQEAKTIYEEEFLVRNTQETLQYFEDNELDEAFVVERIAIDQQIGGFIEKIQDDYMNSDGFKEKQQVLDLVRASHILVETREEAEEIKELIEEEPSRFEMLAKERSTCPSAEVEGDLGYFEYSDMVEEFSKAAFELEVGELSDVVESSFGFHLIRLSDKGNLFEILERGTDDTSLEQKMLELSYDSVGDKLMEMYEEQLVKTPISYYNLEN